MVSLLNAIVLKLAERGFGGEEGAFLSSDESWMKSLSRGSLCREASGLVTDVEICTADSQKSDDLTFSLPVWVGLIQWAFRCFADSETL